MRAVVDTNLLVSGLLWGRNPGRLLNAATQGHLRLCISEALLAELREVLHRAKLAGRLAVRGETPEAVLASVRSICEVVSAPDIPKPAGLRDPKDLMVLSCAKAAKADAILTGDDDLLTMKEFEGIPTLPVREALEKLGMPAE